MLHANSQTTRLLIKERFNRALLDTLDHASHNIIEGENACLRFTSHQ